MHLVTWEAINQLEPRMQTGLGLVSLVITAYALRLIVRLVLLKLVPRFRHSLNAVWVKTLLADNILVRAAQIVPSLVVQTGIAAVPHMPTMATTVIRNVAIALTVLQVARLLNAVLDATWRGPTSINGQQVSLVVVQDPTRRAEIARIAGCQPWIAQAPVFVTVVVDFHKTAVGARLAGELPGPPVPRQRPGQPLWRHQRHRDQRPARPRHLQCPHQR